MRPANIVTAIADILAGIAIAGYFTNTDVNTPDFEPVILLVIATIGLYGGGVVLNDVFDADLDKVERPERPIPSGVLTKGEAGLLGVSLLLIGIIAAAFVHKGNPVSSSSVLAFATAVTAVIYNKWGKHHTFLGPVNMGLCRGLNLLLGISIIPDLLSNYWFIGIVPVAYIAAITMISRGEVHGGSKQSLYGAVGLYGAVILCILYLSYTKDTLLYSSLFLLLFSLMIFRPLFRAIRKPIGPLIGKAVKAGVIALIIMNAAWAAAFGSIYFAFTILLLLPISMLLAKLFAVT